MELICGKIIVATVTTLTMIAAVAVVGLLCKVLYDNWKS